MKTCKTEGLKDAVNTLPLKTLNDVVNEVNNGALSIVYRPIRQRVENGITIIDEIEVVKISFLNDVWRPVNSSNWQREMAEV